MPDHVHVLLTPIFNSAGETYALCELTKGIKGASAREINKLLNRSGYVWQKESFDHELRRDENVRKAAEYICQNPVKEGLCQTPDDYPWLWREWIEGRT
jgi:REP element-mobilizing transposase RayT